MPWATTTRVQAATASSRLPRPPPHVGQRRRLELTHATTTTMRWCRPPPRAHPRAARCPHCTLPSGRQLARLTVRFLLITYSSFLPPRSPIYHVPDEIAQLAAAAAAGSSSSSGDPCGSAGLYSLLMTREISSADSYNIVPVADLFKSSTVEHHNDPTIFIFTELPVKKSSQSFVYNHTLAKALAEYASAGLEMRSLIVDVENCLQVWVQDSKGNTTVQICDNSGEDPHCCRCISMFGLRIQDHFTYLGVDMEADDWSTCRIITTQSVKQFRKELASNIMMTKHNVEVSIVEPSIQTDRSSF
nr:unnamed protein product [Digitaria exilis]